METIIEKMQKKYPGKIITAEFYVDGKPLPDEDINALIETPFNPSDDEYFLSDPNHIKFDDIPIQVLNSIRDIVFYNDLTDKIKKWKIVGEFDDEHEAVPLDEWFTEQHAIWMMCVGMFGDFGTSPRSGWIENKKDFDKFIDYITQDEQPQE